MFSQENKKIDSLKNIIKNQTDDIQKVNAYAALYNTFLYQDQALAKFYAEKELEVSKKVDYHEGIGIGFYHLGVYFNNIDELDSSEIYYLKSLKIFETLGKESLQSDVVHGLAIIKYSRGNYKEALELLEKNVDFYTKNADMESDLAITHVLRSGIYRSQGNYKLALKESLNALKLYEKLSEPIRKADALGALAAAEFNLDNFEESIAYNTEALTIYEAHNDKFYAAQALNDIGDTYFYMDQYEKALDFLYRGLKLSKEVDAKDLMATSLGNIGKVYTKQGKHAEAIPKLSQALEITQKSGNQFKNSETFNDLGIVYNNLKEPQKAIAYFDQSIAIADKIKARGNLRISYFNQSKSYEQLNEYKKALAAYKQFKIVSDSIFNNNKQQQIEELRTIYEIAKKEQQIALQKNEIELLYQQKRNSFLVRLLLILGLLLAIVIAYGIYQKLKKKSIEKERLDAELVYKKKELTTHALHLAKKNEVLEGIKQKALEYQYTQTDSKGYRHLANSIDFDKKDDNNWAHFSKYFNEVHTDFNQKVKERYPNLTANELRLMALLKMNLTSKEIANILNISSDGIKKARYRLRKKLSISTEDSLQELILKL